MVGQYCGCEEEKWKMAGICRLHKSEQGLPKISFPYVSVDQLMDATVGHPQMSFLDAFQGYH